MNQRAQDFAVGGLRPREQLRRELLDVTLLKPSIRPGYDVDGYIFVCNASA